MKVNNPLLTVLNNTQITDNNAVLRFTKIEVLVQKMILRVFFYIMTCSATLSYYYTFLAKWKINVFSQINYLCSQVLFSLMLI